jgi:mono/diheme cytochrome c family protein
VSEAPPIHPNWNMDQQERYDPQEPNPFFDDGRAMRAPVEGTVAFGHLNEDDHYYRGEVDGRPAQTLPNEIEFNRALLERGQARFNIYCVPCHDQAGTGDGIVTQRGINPPPPSFHEAREMEPAEGIYPDLRQAPIGHFFQVMTNGWVRMQSYATQVPVEDRWAIAAYIRALQISRSATLDQVPTDVASTRGWR